MRDHSSTLSNARRATFLWEKIQIWNILKTSLMRNYLPRICGSSFRSRYVHQTSETGLEHILEPLFCKFFEIFILIAIANTLFEVPVKGHLVKFVKRPHHQMQLIPTKGTNIGLWSEIMEDTFLHGHLGCSGPANPTLAVADESLVTPNYF